MFRVKTIAPGRSYKWLKSAGEDAAKAAIWGKRLTTSPLET